MALDVAPDGRTIVFDLLGDLYALPIGGGRATRLTHGPAYDAQPRYSPDGREIVFVSDRAGSEDIWLMGSRSEEHTSELQSLMRNSYAVFCLKKQTKHTTYQ